jgi:energy-coupling factor transporter transmembrane protein EcfT
MTKQQVTHRYQFPFLGILTLIFITLKLTGHITWSWLWVLSPLWIPLALFAVLVVALVVWENLYKGGKVR